MLTSRRSRTLSLLAAGLAVGALSAPSAGAATVDVNGQGELSYVAAPGEANRLTVSSSGGGIDIAEDGGAALTTGAGCAVTAPGRVRCGVIPSKVIVQAGDGDDDVVLTAGVYGWLQGGAGNDRLVGGAPGNWLDGNDGDDVLIGGTAADRFSGGPGVDTASYLGRTAAIGARLALGTTGTTTNGASGENDQILPDVEALQGGTNNDVLVGDGGPNRIVGGAGTDIIDGQGGADDIQIRDGQVDSVACGTGVDSVVGDPVDSADADCESRDFDPSSQPLVPDPTPTPTPTPGPAPAPQPSAPDAPRDEPGANPAKPATPATPAPPAAFVLPPGGALGLSPSGIVTVAVRCAADAPRACRGSVILTLLPPRAAARRPSHRPARLVRASAAGGAPILASRRFDIAPGAEAKVPLRLSRNARRRVLARRGARCQLRITSVGGDGVARTSTRIVTVNAKGKRR